MSGEVILEQQAFLLFDETKDEIRRLDGFIPHNVRVLSRPESQSHCEIPGIVKHSPQLMDWADVGIFRRLEGNPDILENSGLYTWLLLWNPKKDPRRFEALAEAYANWQWFMRDC